MPDFDECDFVRKDGDETMLKLPNFESILTSFIDQPDVPLPLPI